MIEDMHHLRLIERIEILAGCLRKKPRVVRHVKKRLVGNAPRIDFGVMLVPLFDQHPRLAIDLFQQFRIVSTSADGCRMRIRVNEIKLIRRQRKMPASIG